MKKERFSQLFNAAQLHFSSFLLKYILILVESAW
jgi:hypothetical protein